MPYVQAKAEQRRIIRAVIENEIMPDLGAGLNFAHKIAIERFFVPNLYPLKIAAGGDNVGQTMAMSRQQGRVQNRVKRHYSWTGA